MRYAIVIEKAENNYSAYVPDLPGCVAIGATVEEVERQICQAIEFHLDGLREAAACESRRIRGRCGLARAA
jgi:predicted RNase H-like HicB family nuclease